ncbi:unnamed protein product, partial [Mesorhabditis belari]
LRSLEEIALAAKGSQLQSISSDSEDDEPIVEDVEEPIVTRSEAYLHLQSSRYL